MTATPAPLPRTTSDARRSSRRDSAPLPASVRQGVIWSVASTLLPKLCLLFANMLAGVGRTRFLLVVQLVWLGALVLAMVIGVHRDGIVGAAVAHLVVIGPIVLPSYLFALKRAISIRYAAPVKAILPALLASSAAVLAARWTASQIASPLGQLTAGLAVGSLIYLVAMAPHLITLISSGETMQLRMRHVLRLYHSAGRLTGLPVGPRPKRAKGIR